MIYIDKMFSKEELRILAGMIGRHFDGFRLESIIPGFSEAAFGMVEFSVAGQAYTLTNKTEMSEFFGGPQDVATMHLTIGELNEARESFGMIGEVDANMITEVTLGETIKDVRVYSDKQIQNLGLGDVKEYGYPAALAFQLESTQLVFQKPIWYSEDIYIHQGPDAETRVPAAIEAIDESQRRELRAKREIISLNK